MIDLKYIGHESEPLLFDVEKGQLKFFATAAGETNPIFFDEDAARDAGYPTLPAPPSFMWTMQLAMPSNLEMMGVDMRAILHAEQTFKHHQLIFAGDRIDVRRRIEDIYVKKNGALEFVVEVATATNQHGQLCTESRSVTAIRHAV